jgi:hypothetical protein
MAAVIHKKELPLQGLAADGSFGVMLPADAFILSLHEQYNRPCIWYRTLDPSGSVSRKSFTWYGTGHECHHDSMDFRGTVLLDGGSLVLHLFEHPTLTKGVL